MTQHSPRHSPVPVLFEFAKHAFVGTVVFLLVYVPAVVLHFVVEYLEGLGSGETLVFIMEWVKVAVVVIDSLFYLAFMTATAWDSFKQLRGLQS